MKSHEAENQPTIFVIQTNAYLEFRSYKVSDKIPNTSRCTLIYKVLPTNWKQTAYGNVENRLYYEAHVTSQIE